ncbi:MAG: hypothetical protein IT436_03915 [Phycisphaerales bacterium]|nr:hypothetical protein [Phycisphaerales bacterium]
MNTEVSKPAAVEAAEPKPVESRGDKNGRETSPQGGRNPRSWLGDAPTGEEAGTHVVSRIGVCHADGPRRRGETG